MKLTWTVLVLGLVGCASDSVADGERPSGSVGVTQAGAQDAAHFRNLIKAGSIPEPGLLDQVGFFAEHALDQPPADCGEVVCAHPSLAVAPRFDDGTWTMAFVSLNSAVDPETRPREPVHLVLTVESSAAAVEVTKTGTATIEALLAELEPEDRLSVVSFGQEPKLLVSGAVPGESDVSQVVLPAAGPGAKVDLYAGIAAAADVVGSLSGFAGGSRIVLLTTGRADAGITDQARIIALAESLVREGTQLSVLGMSRSFNAELPRSIAELGAGNFAFAESADDLQDVVVQEAGVRLVPLASDVELRVVPSAGYRVGRMYGARRASVEDGVAVLRAPALFLGTRSSAMDTEQGRRGGGGGLFVELLADPELSAEIGPNQPAFRLETSYRDVDAALAVSFEAEVSNDLSPGERPAENWPHFSTPEYGKAFMMLNMYLALRAMVDLHEAGDCAAALGVSYMMEPGADEWQRRFDDPDIGVDRDTMLGLRENIEMECHALPVPPSNYEAGCFGI
jgi:Ca-activated chloride channel family protein